MPINRVAYTAPINSQGASPVLSLPQLWSCMQLKIRAAQDFVGGALVSTDVIEETTAPMYPGTDSKETIPVTVREVVFREGNRRVKEVVKAHEPMKVVFEQPDGSVVTNLISEGSKGGEEEGDHWLTYFFESKLPDGLSEADVKERKGKQRKMAQVAVEESIKACRRLVEEGRVK